MEASVAQDERTRAAFDVLVQRDGRLDSMRTRCCCCCWPSLASLAGLAARQTLGRTGPFMGGLEAEMARWAARRGLLMGEG